MRLFFCKIKNFIKKRALFQPQPQFQLQL